MKKRHPKPTGKRSEGGQRNVKAKDKPIAHIVHGGAKIIKAMISTNNETGRVAITARCKMADGSTRTIGILDVRKAHSANFADIGKQLLTMANARSMTKGDMVKAKEDLLAE